MKNTNRLMTLFIGIIMMLGGLVCIGLHMIFIYLAVEPENFFCFKSDDASALFIRTAIAFTVCGLAQLINGILILLYNKKPKKITFILNIAVIAVSAVLILLSSVSEVNLMPIQMLTGVIVPILYFVVYFITAPSKK